MKILIITLIALIGATLGILSKKSQVQLSKKKASLCSEISKKVDDNQELRTKCLYYIPNAGLKFDLSSSQSAAKVKDLFTTAMRDHYEADNEFNVNTNDSPFGESAQKNDPRDKLLVRFDIKEKIKATTRKPGFISDLRSALKQDMKCSPTLTLLKGSSRSTFWDQVSNKSFSSKSELGLTGSKSFLSMMNRVFGIYGDNRIMQRYKLYENSCTQGVSVPINFCYSDPRYDLEIHDIFISPSEQKALEKIYCKKTSDSSWSLIKTIQFKIREEN